MSEYDSTGEILAHIKKVREYISGIILELVFRSDSHDASKFTKEEKEIFDEVTPMLGLVEYGSREYFAVLGRMKPALDHHYQNNRHHPEHYENGVNGMCLVDAIEMLCDWYAAWQRKKKGTFKDAMLFNKGRFQIDDQFFEILLNTAKSMKWIEQE